MKTNGNKAEKISRESVEHLTYSRISALSGNYLVLYTVDPVTEGYVEFSATKDFEELGLAKSGKEFFAASRINGERAVFAADLQMYRQRFTKENVLREIEERGLFLMHYRLVMDGSPVPVCLRAALVSESDGDKLLVGVTRDEDSPAGPQGSAGEASAHMDFQAFADSVGMPCCVMSVERTPDGGCGDIRIVCANQTYKSNMGPSYYDGMPYHELVPKDNKFEDFCFRAAILKQRMHAYVETKALGWWIDQTLIPLEGGSGDIGYCQFVFEFTAAPETDRLANVSASTAEKVIQSCITLMSGKDFKESVAEVLDLVMQASGARAGRIMLIDHEKDRASIFCERCDDADWPNRVPGRDVISYEIMSSWKDLIGESNAIMIRDEQDLAAIEAENPQWARTMRENGVDSLVLVPLRRSGEEIGYMYVVNFDVSRIIELKELVELLAYFLGSEISNHMLLERLETISKVDVLTGIMNRRAMISRIKQIAKEGGFGRFGVVSIDLNGLKTVNDNEGHDAGDRLLIMAGEILKKVFYEDDLFRTGGDEFIVISESIDEKTFERKVKKLGAAAAKNDSVSFAVGTFWSDGSTDLTKALRIADERMYEAKKQYYEKNPQLRSR